MRTAIRYSQYKSSGKLPHNEVFDCSTCMYSPRQEKRNCRGEFDTKYKYTIGTMEYNCCPVSVYAFDKEVGQVIDLIQTSLDSGIPVTQGGLLDQTQSFFDYTRIIRDEEAVCYHELEKLNKIDESRSAARSSMQKSPSMGRR